MLALSWDILAREPFSPELMPLTMVPADPPGRMIRWLDLAGATAGRLWHLQPPHKHIHILYTPTLDGYERFLREMVGLDDNIPERRQYLGKRNRQRRQDR